MFAGSQTTQKDERNLSSLSHYEYQRVSADKLITAT